MFRKGSKNGSLDMTAWEKEQLAVLAAASKATSAFPMNGNDGDFPDDNNDDGESEAQYTYTKAARSFQFSDDFVPKAIKKLRDRDPTFFHGRDGLGTVWSEPSKPASQTEAVQEILHQIKQMRNS